MRSLEEHHFQLTELDAVALGIGVESVPPNEARAEPTGNKNTRLISDFRPHEAWPMPTAILPENGGFS